MRGTLKSMKSDSSTPDGMIAEIKWDPTVRVRNFIDHPTIGH
jgi:hypothetical protein